ncbi:MAG TPA: DUF6600 domain-containing protein [Candidatus Dormibacteraeota bacterium]|nr:DUF6600 domain-containing protein [Candidatus Dormibacteraeota bacterium]
MQKYPLKKTQNAAQNSALIAIASLAGFTGCTTTRYVEQPAPPPVVYTEPAAPVYVEPATPAELVIHDERDFYEPLSPYGHWEYIGAYGRCWVPAGVGPGWRPYSNGHWERTDVGWYWMSDEPWGWATYHYGRWDFDPRFGWFWVPQTMWGPAWVTWYDGGGYVGWAALPPSARITGSGVVEVNIRAVPEHAHVFVEERRFLEPVRPSTVVNNTTIINKTVNITNVKVVNKTVINEGPRTAQIEHANKVHAVPARELRDKIEAPVAARHRAQNKEREGSSPPVEPKPRVTGPALTTTVPTPAPTPNRTDADRKTAERARQEKLEADRKAQADAERARQAAIENAKMQAEQQRKAEAEVARRKQEADARAREQATIQNAKLEAEQQRKAEAEVARKKQEAEARAREQATRDARQKQMEEAQNLSHGPSVGAHGKGPEKKNQAESERQQQKGRSKKVTEPQPDRAATNAPGTP